MRRSGGYFGDARSKPLFGWVVTGEIIGGLGLLSTAIFAVLAIGWVRQPRDFDDVTAIIATGFPWYLVLWSTLAAVLTFVGVVWVIIALLARAVVIRRRSRSYAP
ncbi:hypothetical protein [Microlunatus speluncae]|uniref:hypothetical protein n=1 Tax=Microlunatus speluncae TaxID=2594267 RepID=UPI0012667364|nr:hypothetical protein [Microlunatus speluncae]